MIGSKAQLRSAPRFRGRRGLARLVALGVTVACFAAQLSSLSHLSAAPHIRCQEHGELEDLVSTAHAGEVLHDEATVENRATPDPRRGHEHCIFGAQSRHTQATDPAHTQAPLAVLAARTAPIPKAAAPAPRLVLYRLAPKTSPPA